MQVIDPRELNDLAAFASRGGLGHGVALTDCVAEQPDQLMYLSGDSLILLRDLGSILIASCEGVVGWVDKSHVKFEHLASTSSPTSKVSQTGSTSSSRSGSTSITPHPDLPRTVVHSPSPPPIHSNLPIQQDHSSHETKKLSAEARSDIDKRVSGPFELDSPLGTPGVEETERGFEVPRARVEEDEQEVGNGYRPESMFSEASANSSAFGGIAGFMMGSDSPPGSEHGDGLRLGEESSPGFSELAVSPITPGPAGEMSHDIILATPSTPKDKDDFSPTSLKSQATAQSEASWDIYDSYGRESMYVAAAKRASTRASGSVSQTSNRKSYDVVPHPPKSGDMVREVPSDQGDAIEKEEILDGGRRGIRDSRESFQSAISRSSSTSPIGSMYRASMISTGSWDGFEAARQALQRVGVGRKWTDGDGEDGQDSDEDDGAFDIVGGRGAGRAGMSELKMETEEAVESEDVGQGESDSRRPSFDDRSEDSHTSSTISEDAPPRPVRRRPLATDLSAGIPDLKETPSETPETPRAAPRASSRMSSDPDDNPVKPTTPRKSSISELGSRSRERTFNGSIDGPITPQSINFSREETTPKRSLRIANPDSDDEAEEPVGAPISATQSSDGNHASTSSNSGTSTAIVTPNPPTEPVFDSSPTRRGPIHDSPEKIITISPKEIKIQPTLLDSPLAMDRESSLKSPVLHHQSTPGMTTSDSIQSISLRTPGTGAPPPRRPSFTFTQPPSTSSPSDHAMRPPMTPWQTNSPSSPHSIDATRQAVEAVRKTPEAKRARGMTLVGRMEADLGASKGPVPITFLVGDSTLAATVNASLSPPLPSSMGLGFPARPGTSSSTSSGNSGMKGMKKSPSLQSTLASPLLDIDDPVQAMKIAPSAYPQMRSTTNPLPPPQIEKTSEPSMTSGGMPKPGFFPRPRSRSFSAAVSKVMAKKAGTGGPGGQGLTIQTNNVGLVPALPSPNPSSTTTRSSSIAVPPRESTSGSVKRPFFSRSVSIPSSHTTLAPGISNPNQPPTPSSPAISLGSDIIGFLQSDNTSSTALPQPPPSARSSSFSFRLPKSSKSSLNVPVPTPGTGTGHGPTSIYAPVSNKDYEDTIKADGLDFEIVQPKSKRDLLEPSSAGSEDGSAEGGVGLTGGSELRRKDTVISSLSGTSGKSLRTLPDTDEWGFVKEKSPTPEVFMGRAGGAGQRALEQKWLAIINTPLGSSAPPKKVRKLAIESGIPASLRGRVWAWFMTPTMSARRPGLYQELLDHDREDKRLADRIDSDVEAAYPDHSIYSEASTGQTDLRSILRAYSHFATGGYRSEMSLIAGMLLIHCVAEDAFWLLSGFVNGSLKDYYASPTGQSGGKATGMRVDAAVFAGVLAGSEPKLAKLFRDVGLHPIVFLEEWYSKLFLRCLPWPTALRIIDAVIAEGPRFLLIASLTILTLSRDRLLALPRTYTDILAYLRDIPQDALLLPEGFMKACENVRFKEEDMRRMRTGVEKELGLSVA